MMGSQQKSAVGKCSVFWLIILWAIVTAAAIVLVVMLASTGDTGLSGSGSIVMGTCSQSYFTKKYSNINTIDVAVFICSCFAILSSTIVLFVFMRWMCKSCSNSLQPSEYTKGFLFCLVSLTILASITPLGYYLSFILQLGSCSNNTVNITNIIIILLLSAAILLFSFIVLIILLCQNYTHEQEEKYKHVQTTQTEHNEESKQMKNARVKDNLYNQRRSPVKVKQDQYTKQQIAPKKYVKQKPHQPGIYLQRKDKNNNQLQSNLLLPRPVTRSPQYPQQNIVQHLHPQFISYNKGPYADDYRPQRDRRGTSRGQFNDKGWRGQQDYRNRNRDDRDRDRHRDRDRDNDRDFRRSPQRRHSPPDRRRVDYEDRDRDYRMDDNRPYDGRVYSPSRGQQRSGIMKRYGRYRY